MPRGKDYLSIAFINSLVEGLYPDNSFYKNSVDDSAFIQGEEILLPHAGAIPGVKIDRSGNGVPVEREDTHHKYPLREFSTDPTKVKITEEFVANYAKRESVVYNHRMALNNSFANYIANEWVSGADIEKIPTTGDNRAATYGTGNRKAITYKDLLTAQEKLNNQNVPYENRFALITPKQLRDLLEIEEIKSSDFNKVKPLVKGTIGEFLGFTFYVRSSTVRLTAAGGVRAYDSTTTADTDSAGAIFWQREFVRRAEGNADVLINERDATLYGDAISALSWGSGSRTRKDNQGVVLLYEAAGA